MFEDLRPNLMPEKSLQVHLPLVNKVLQMSEDLQPLLASHTRQGTHIRTARMLCLLLSLLLLPDSNLPTLLFFPLPHSSCPGSFCFQFLPAAHIAMPSHRVQSLAQDQLLDAFRQDRRMSILFKTWNKPRHHLFLQVMAEQTC